MGEQILPIPCQRYAYSDYGKLLLSDQTLKEIGIGRVCKLYCFKVTALQLQEFRPKTFSGRVGSALSWEIANLMIPDNFDFCSLSPFPSISYIGLKKFSNGFDEFIKGPYVFEGTSAETLNFLCCERVSIPTIKPAKEAWFSWAYIP